MNLYHKLIVLWALQSHHNNNKNECLLLLTLNEITNIPILMKFSIEVDELS